MGRGWVRGTHRIRFGATLLRECGSTLTLHFTCSRVLPGGAVCCRVVLWCCGLACGASRIPYGTVRDGMG